jgi:hypothetical protein
VQADCGELPESMKHKIFITFGSILIASLPALAQQKLYPVRDTKDSPALVTRDRSAFVIEKSFQHKSTLGFPSENNVAFVPETGAPIVMLWLRVQNTSQRPIEVNTTAFMITDDQGKTYMGLTSEDAANRIVAGGPGGSLGTKALRGISLGKAAGVPPEEQLRDDIQRYSLQSRPIQPGAVGEGLIYFDGPQRKKFTVTVTLAELWSKPLVFSTEKQK